MKGMSFPLTMALPGKELTLVSIVGGRGLRQKLTEMGLKEKVKLKIIHSHLPGPCIIMVDKTRLVLGHGMAQKIMVKEE